MSKYSLKQMPSEITSLSQLQQVRVWIDELFSKQRSDIASKKNDTTNKLDKNNLPECIQCFFSSEVTWENLSELKIQLDKIIETSTVTTITLSDIPSTEMKMKIVSWFRSINSLAMVEFLTDASIVGGLIVRTEKRRYDLSLRKILENVDVNKIGILNDVQ